MLDLVQMRSFVTVAHAGSFTLAAERLGLGQSTVSQHVQRLEAGLGRRLIARDTHRVSLTSDGEALLVHARAMLSIEGSVQSLFKGRDLRGRLRLGVSEDLAGSHLPDMLEDFVRSHPRVDLELTVALSDTLNDMREAGTIDLVLAKRRIGDGRGRLVYREPLVWLARDPERILGLDPLPLIAFPPPSITRAIALDALARDHVPWRIVCTCGSLSGLTAAARAGMGVLVQPRSLAPSGLRDIGKGKLPLIEDVEFVLVTGKDGDQALISAVSEDLLTKARSLRPL